VITDGTHGSDVWTPDGGHFHQPAFTAEPLVDTTGCGDVYHGAFLHGWLCGWPLERCAAYASRLAARNAEGLGGRHVLKDFTLNLEV
jgi:sulfofructose kinase